LSYEELPTSYWVPENEFSSPSLDSSNIFEYDETWPELKKKSVTVVKPAPSAPSSFEKDFFGEKTFWNFA